MANVAEETIHPQRNVLIGFESAILTLVTLAVMTFISAVGVGGWEHIVYAKPGIASDSPLPLALKGVMGDSHFMYHMLIFIELFGLVANLHGIILAAGRAVLEMGRAKFVPPILDPVSPRFRTPAVALQFYWYPTTGFAWQVIQNQVLWKKLVALVWKPDECV